MPSALATARARNEPDGRERTQCPAAQGIECRLLADRAVCTACAAAQVGEAAGRGRTLNVPWLQAGLGDADYLAAFELIVMP